MGKSPKKVIKRWQAALFGISGGLLMSSVMLLFLTLANTPRGAVIRYAAAAEMPEMQLIGKTYEYSPPQRENALLQDKISYEMKLDMQKVQEHHAVNPDVVGWIYMPDLPVDYPIVQGQDNDKYLHRDWTGADSFAGCIFEDYRSRIENSENALLYGHNMASGSMFAGIRRFRDPEWTKTHMYFEVATLSKRYLYKVVSVNVLYGLNGAEFRYWDCIDMGRKDFEAFTQNIRETAEVWYGWAEGTDKAPAYGTRIITLQTCMSGADDGMRVVVFGECLGER